MNVLCVQKFNPECCYAPVEVEVGGIYKVVRTHDGGAFNYTTWDGLYYEFSHQKDVAYRSDYFVPIDPTPDEVKEYTEPETQVV